MEQDFLNSRVHQMPYLGLGVSTEFGAFQAENSLDIARLRSEFPQYAQFLEVGVESSKGIDKDVVNWVESGGRTTYHFLDINLYDPMRLDLAWLTTLRATMDRIGAAWVCGDAGLWFFGQRHPLQMTLLPPIFEYENALEYAKSLRICRSVFQREVLPENPPGAVFIGSLDLLSFYAHVCEQADTGMLLDAAHLSIYQSLMGRHALDGLADFPLERIVELHVAGSTATMVDGLKIWTDDHHPTVRPETWKIAEYVAMHAPNLRAVVFECERNPMRSCLEGFQRLRNMFGDKLAGS